MAVLRCERLESGDVDRAIASIGSAALARTPDGSFIEVDDALADETVRRLAFGGIRASSAATLLVPRAGTRPAIGRDLRPLPLGSLALDLVHVRALPVGPETERLLRRSWWRPVPAARRALVRDLLRGTEIIVGWRRRAWTTREVLRSSVARRVLRPVVFDLAALGAPPEHRVLVRETALAGWLFG